MNSIPYDRFKEQIAIEKMLYGDPPAYEYVEIQNEDFLVKIFGMYPKLRPHKLGNFVLFCSNYLKEKSFRKIVLEKVFTVCPTLIQRLYHKESFDLDEIRESLELHQSMFLYLFFKNEIELDYSGFPDYQCSLELLNETELDSIIEFGFRKTSMEFCLKYDHFEEFDSKMMINPNKRECQWSPFEWAEKPKSLDFLSFSGFFGSLKCFRALLLAGFGINELVVCSVVFSGSEELFQYVSDQNSDDLNCLCIASSYCYLRVVEYLVNKKTSIRAKNKDAGFRF